jgi:hypothetical protein
MCLHYFCIHISCLSVCQQQTIPKLEATTKLLMNIQKVDEKLFIVQAKNNQRKNLANLRCSQRVCRGWHSGMCYQFVH